MLEKTGAPDTIRTCGLCLRRAAPNLNNRRKPPFFHFVKREHRVNMPDSHGVFTGATPGHVFAVEGPTS